MVKSRCVEAVQDVVSVMAAYAALKVFSIHTRKWLLHIFGLPSVYFVYRL